MDFPLRAPVIAALSVMAFVLGIQTLAAAQTYLNRISDTDDTISSTDLLAAPGTSDSGVFSTFEAPVVTAPAASENENQLLPSPPFLTELPPCAGCDENPEITVGEAKVLPGPASYVAQNDNMDADDVVTSWIGVSVSIDRRKLKSGGYANGLLIVDVQAGSPAANAGLHPLVEGKIRTAAEIATLAAGMVFPPAMIGVAIISSTQLDQSYDMIIGIDGDRITNIFDFEERMRMVQPGQIVYLNIVHNGLRQQIPVQIPLDTDTQYQCSFLPCFVPP